MDQTTTTPDTIEAALARVSAAWDAGDATAYANEFTDDATYVIYAGIVYAGREAIERGHVPVFEKWQKGSRMRMRVISVRPIGDDVAVVLTEGGIGKRRIPIDKVQTFTMLRRDGRWQCAAFQNTKKNRLFIRMNSTFDPSR
ncbi:SgcJ/EcaC family oxidoreductase [Agromyces mariniharenae]|uniref:SgcJ/EcaC family oxidoreductase n=1 Tax=Agromyces mariniharenae TaxID=2604423 RepID=A0A5S4V4U2_9MICO|nr:SgcJ/EcaC family oxidoreductase [Agromyces mariniharenae]TYL52853.1 SgcJ/EcaC family oxidoreductase [Agromyces mariniharenae]